MSFDEWKKYKLGDLGVIARGKSKHRPRDASFLYGGKYPFIQTGDIKAANHKIKKHTQTYTEDGLKQSKLWPEGTICITIAANIGDTAILSYPACFPDSVIGFVANKELVNNDFVEYLLQHYRLGIKSHAVGSVQDNINLATFERIEFKIPNLQVQNRIASILSSLDEKIELNRQTNQTLEAISQTLFKEMCLPESDELPEGWKNGKLSEVCDVNKNTLNKKVDFITWLDYIEISEVSRGIIGNVTRYILGEEPSRAKRKLKHGDIVLSTVRPDRGSYFLAINPAPTDIVSTGFAVFSPIKVPFSFLYLFLTDEVSLKYYGHVANGGAYPAINPNVIMNMDLVIPNKEVLVKFHEIVEPMLFQINQNEQENKILASIRDGLLPKLMNGVIKTNLT